MIKLEIKAWTISPFGGGWGVEKQPKVHPPAPSKGGDSSRSNFGFNHVFI